MIYSEEQKDLFSVSDDYYLVQCISADFAMGAGIAQSNLMSILIQEKI